MNEQDAHDDAAHPDARHPDADPAPRRPGPASWLRAHPRATLVTAAVAAFALLAGGAVAAGAATAPEGESTSTPVAGPTTVVTVTPSPTATTDPARSVPAEIPAPTRLRTCSVATPAADPRLAQFEGSVVNATTGEVLFDRDGSTPARTGSVMKTLTSAVALAVLGADYRLTTTVTGDPGSGSVALVGGGDATLSATRPERLRRMPPRSPTSRPRSQASLGEPARHPDHPRRRRSGARPTSGTRRGSAPSRPSATTEVTALMVDGDRADPSAQTSPRSTDPVARAGDAFRAALVAAGVVGADTAADGPGDGARTTRRSAPSRSQPVSTLIGQMPPNSDNTLAEMLARVSSKESGADGSAALLTTLYRSALQTPPTASTRRR